MSGLIIKKVTEIPAQVEPNTMYLLLSSDANSVEIYISDSDGTIALPLKNSQSDILTATSMYFAQFGSNSSF